MTSYQSKICRCTILFQLYGKSYGDLYSYILQTNTQLKPGAGDGFLANVYSLSSIILAYTHKYVCRQVLIHINTYLKAARCPLTSAGFVVHLPFPEHSRSLAWPSPGTQTLAFTTRVKRRATIDLVTESFTKPKRKWDNRKCEIKLYQQSFHKTINFIEAAFESSLQKKKKKTSESKE